ncbi:zinc ribbon domain-containing protein [Sphingomonas sp. JC676]|uniref:zinc ribbon domain-containing protein n=1 Tax=Sphingomonas sp. JC676 TaxID=2768065 RepID=UPI0016576B4D|nr:zinc ribbon domain-containing protein [Sphingomonas sp. JC676]MBC9031225.1 zinc ribbon domain-containing protein [Sphingomonas sp. JC676]
MWKWIKVPKIVALLAFILPWMTVSCSGTKLISATGFGLAFGRYTAEVSSERIATASSNAVMNPWLILALVAIVVGLIVSLRSSSKASALFLTAASSAGVALIWLRTMRYSKTTILAEAAKRGRRATGFDPFSDGVDRTAASLIHIEWHFGFYLAVLTLVAAGVMAWLTNSGRDAALERSVRDTMAKPAAPVEHEPAITCPTCGRSHPAGTRFCPDDGTALS